MHEHQNLPPRTLFIASVAYLLASVAATAAQTAPVFADDPVGFTGSLPLILSIGATPVVAAIVRRHPGRRPLTIAQLAMLIAVAFQPAAGNRFALEMLLSVVLIGQLVLGAVVLVMAWRAPLKRRAILAGVFVMPQVLTEAVLLEVFQFDGMVDDARLTVFAMILLIFGLITSTGIPLEESGGPTRNERGLDRITIVGAALALGGSAAIADRANPFDNGGAVVAASIALLAGFILLGVFRQRRATGAPGALLVPEAQRTPPVHIDPALLTFAAVASVLIVWAEFGSQFFGSGGTLLGPNLPVAFDDVDNWRRVMALGLLPAVLPLVAAIAQGGRRLISLGALAGAVAAVVWVAFVLSDLEVGLVEFLTFGVLIEIARLSVVGGAIVFALRRIDDASIEAGLVFFLAALPLFSLLANQLAVELVGADLVASNFDDTDNLQLFTIASAVGLVWIAAWWAFRPDRSRESDPVLVDQTSGP